MAVTVRSEVVRLRAFCCTTVSAVALVAATPAAFAQESVPQDDATVPGPGVGGSGGAALPQDGTGRTTAVPADEAGSSDIVVTGLRQSIATSQAIKFNSDQFVDSITATDIGKLPDRNVAEALQRISGIQISRNLGEGSSIAVRGLTDVKTELNGRDVFGGSDGRALGFEDVPSELLAGVDVYKNPSAKEIEGGIGGLVNLRTRMPFDEKGFVVSASLGANYYDLAEEAKVNGSVLVSKTWENTGIGDIGVLFDVSYFEGAFRRDQATIEPYVESTTVPGYEGQAVSIPDGAGVGVTFGNRKRKGYYGAFQWEPATNFQVYATAFRSEYNLYTPNYTSFVTRSTDDRGVSGLTPNGNFAFDDNGHFVSGGYAGLVPAYSLPPTYSNSDTNLAVQNNTQVAFSRSKTTDIAGGFKWEPVDNFHVNLDLQYVRATAQTESYTAFTQKDLASYYVDLSGDLPSIVFGGVPGGASLYDPSSYTFTALMDHLEDSKATQKAGRLDLGWDFDEGFLTSVQTGIRYTDREALNRSTPYNWSGTTTTLSLADPSASPIANPYADDFFGGDGRDMVGAVPFPSVTLFNNAGATFEALVGRGLSTFGTQDVNTQREKTYTGYGIAYFEFDPGLRIDGNVGVRVVKTQNEAVGSTRLSYRDGTGADSEQFTVDEPFSSEQDYTKVLPSLNLRAHLTEKLQARLALSKAMTRPSFYNLRAIRTLSLNYNAITDSTGAVIGYDPTTSTGTGGNPDLKPQTANQADVSLEWNAGPTTFVYGTLFYKKLKNYITTRAFDVEYDVPGQGTQTFEYTAFVNGNKGTVKGFEVGGNTFFNFLPGVLSGLGVQANLTYVDSDAGDFGTLENGQQVPTELEGLSKWSYNLVGLYQKDGVNIRLAYNWRDDFLKTRADNGTGNIPIYNKAYGQLDASIGYDFNKNVSFTIDAVNLTRARYDTYQYYSYNPRTYELNDRRVGFTVRIRN